MVFVNFPVSNLERSVEFYKKLGFQQNVEYSNEQASAMVWNEDFWVMLLSHDFYKLFIGDKKIADTKLTSSSLIAFDMKSADEVKKFAKIAEENGGSYFYVDMGMPEDQMYSLEVDDPDGNRLEPIWMPVP